MAFAKIQKQFNIANQVSYHHKTVRITSFKNDIHMSISMSERRRE